MMRSIQMNVNGETYKVEVNPHETLLDVIREKVGLTGTKKGCDTGQCGACTVIMNGKAVNACLVLAVESHGKEILTVEGLARDGHLHPLQEAFVQEGAVQCGFCSPGMLLTAKALLEENPQPTEREVKEAIAGNLCRCTGYVKIVKAILTASEKIFVGEKIKGVVQDLDKKSGL
jgi:carbon-monoxide dehydrogenase small subunit